VTRFFHAMVLADNNIPDLTRPPLCPIEVNFSHSLELSPLLAAIVIIPLIHGHYELDHTSCADESESQDGRPSPVLCVERHSRTPSA
jgi:hypothetical protein